MKFIRTIPVAILLCLTVAGCREVQHGSVMVDADASAWPATDTLRVTYTNTDTVRLRDIDFTARIEPDMTSELPMRIVCTSPSGETIGVDCTFSTASASRKATLADLSEPFLDDTLLSEAGDYVFEFIPAVTLEGVWAVGIELFYGKR